MQWYSDGHDASIPNYYHFRLYLNRICAVNPTQQRGNGYCYNHSYLGRFRFSQYFPNSFINHQHAYDAVVGRVDFLSTFLFSAMGAFFCAALLALCPATFIADDAGSCAPRMVARRSRVALLFLASAVSHTASSIALTVTFVDLLHWMEYVPQVSNIWGGHVPLTMSWVASASLIVATLVLQDDVASARSLCRAIAHQRDTADGFESDIFGSREPPGLESFDVARSAWLQRRHLWLDFPLRRTAIELLLWARRRGKRRARAASGTGAFRIRRSIGGLFRDDGSGWESGSDLKKG